MKLINKLKKIKNEANLGVTVAIVIAIIAVVNFLAYQLFFRVDLTKNKDYSLSAVSKDTVRNLDDIVNIKVYFSKNLPSQYINLPQDVADILDEYQNYSKGKIKVESLDPTDNKELQQKLRIQGIPELQFNVLEKDKYQIVKGYLGMTISYGDKTEAIPVIQDTGNLEYSITSNIKKLTSKSMPIIGYLTSNGTLDMQKEVTKAAQAVSSLYEIRQVNLSTDKKIPDDISTLVIAGPTQKFSQDDQKAIDAFVMRGGGLLLLIDGVKVDNALNATKNDPGLDSMLKKYGINFNHNLVLDVSSGQASFNQGFFTFSIDYPFWPKVLKGGLDKNNPVTAKLESLIFPFASSMDVDNGLANGNKISYLAKSTNQAWQQNDNYNLNPQQVSDSPQQRGQFTLAIADFGKFNSAFGKKSIDNGKIVIVGDSDFIRDNFSSAGDNLAFFQNLVDSLSLDEALINIRAKGVINHPITKQLSDSDKVLLRYANVFGITVIVVCFGLYRYYSRRKRKFSDGL